MIYLDSSALVKLVREEAESAALGTWLSARAPTSLLSSELAAVEVVRMCRRWDDRALPAARGLLTGLDLIRLSRDVVTAAAELADPLLRTLDALHLASALTIGPALVAFVAYDERLRRAADTAGLTCVTPGRS